jgi:hypothetical protein
LYTTFNARNQPRFLIKEYSYGSVVMPPLTIVTRTNSIGSTISVIAISPAITARPVRMS